MKRSSKPLPGHASELGNILSVDHISLYDNWLGVLLHWLLGELNSIVDDKKRVVGSKNLVVEGNSVQVLFKD